MVGRRGHLTGDRGFGPAAFSRFAAWATSQPRIPFPKGSAVKAHHRPGPALIAPVLVVDLPMRLRVSPRSGPGLIGHYLPNRAVFMG
jgi:hypothetical protein